MTTSPEFEVGVWRDGRGDPVVLLYGVKLHQRVVEAARMTVTERMRRGRKRLQLVSEDGRRESVTVDWRDEVKPALYGDVTLKRI